MEIIQIRNFEDYIQSIKNLKGKVFFSQQDYVAKIKLLRILGQLTGICFQRCGALDGLNAIFHTTYIIDKNKNTNYHKRFVNYLQYPQNKNQEKKKGQIRATHLEQQEAKHRSYLTTYLSLMKEFL